MIRAGEMNPSVSWGVLRMETLLYQLVHVDQHLKTVIQDYGAWTYALLFLIILVETGLVVTPLLPGDSLLFAAGTFAALGNLNVGWLLILLTVAAVLGDTVNYWLGRHVGNRAFEGRIPMVKKKHLLRTQNFYEKYGSKTIILARFVPIVRTFAPFVAGIGSMTYPRFVIYNIAGALLWVTLFVLGGVFFR
jgi:membrane-associated protein